MKKYICIQDFNLEYVNSDNKLEIISIEDGSVWQLAENAEFKFVTNGYKLYRSFGKKIMWIELEKFQFNKFFSHYK